MANPESWDPPLRTGRGLNAWRAVMDAASIRRGDAAARWIPAQDYTPVKIGGGLLASPPRRCSAGLHAQVTGFLAAACAA